jgi:hypothetical protein
MKKVSASLSSLIFSAQDVDYGTWIHVLLTRVAIDE